MSEKMNGEFVKWWEQQNEDHLDKLTAREAWQAAWAACRDEAVKAIEADELGSGEWPEHIAYQRAVDDCVEAIRGL